jgi:cytochrome c oxidase subunit 2
VPCAILVFISVPSFSLALALDEVYRPDIWVKVIGNQWFWTYEFSAFNDVVEISSVILQGDELYNNSLRLLAPDNSICLPYNKYVRLLITSVDVIHAWAVPALGVKVDACPGRINSITILPTRLGVFYGQCSEICGVNHAFMPISVEVIV